MVAKEINTGNDLTLFAATPAWEAIKMLFSMAVTQGIGWFSTKVAGRKVDVIDVRRAYFNAPSRREVFVQLPAEDWVAGMCGLLGKSVYGTIDAAQNWEYTYTQFLNL